MEKRKRGEGGECNDSRIKMPKAAQKQNQTGEKNHKMTDAPHFCFIYALLIGINRHRDGNKCIVRHEQVFLVFWPKLRRKDCGIKSGRPTGVEEGK